LSVHVNKKMKNLILFFRFFFSSIFLGLAQTSKRALFSLKTL
jgi:hypothetical protein